MRLLAEDLPIFSYVVNDILMVVQCYCEWEQLGLLFLVFGWYLHVKRAYLHDVEYWLLTYSNLMLLSLLAYNWLTTLVYTILIGTDAVYVAFLSKEESLSSSTSHLVYFVAKIEREEMNLIVYFAALWIALRIYSSPINYDIDSS